MITLPETIKYPDKFLKSPSASFDGVFDWSWTEGCFGETRITPMDLDGVIERKGKFLIFETKDIGVPIPKGQMYTFEALYRLNVFTILFIAGKTHPEKLMAWFQPGLHNGRKEIKHTDITLEYIRYVVESWYVFANGGSL
jgi:hypothetical protein